VLAERRVDQQLHLAVHDQVDAVRPPSMTLNTSSSMTRPRR
jgi:hypothetical protein